MMRRMEMIVVIGKTALVAGATGLVGKKLLRQLLDSTEYTRVIALVRKPVQQLQHLKLQQIVVDYHRLEDYRAEMKADDVFCCLGTTIKQAGTQAQMIEIDVLYPVSVAMVAYKQGAKQFIVISSMGADPKSSIFYTRTKGDMEQRLQQVGYSSLSIVRPSLLLGKRKNSRAGEQFGAVVSQALSFLMIGPLRKYRGIEASDVARAMYRIAQTSKSGTHIYMSDQLQRIADESQSRSASMSKSARS